jgi:hypothetical protein
VAAVTIRGERQNLLSDLSIALDKGVYNPRRGVLNEWRAHKDELAAHPDCLSAYDACSEASRQQCGSSWRPRGDVSREGGSRSDTPTPTRYWMRSLMRYVNSTVLSRD